MSARRPWLERLRNIRLLLEGQLDDESQGSTDERFKDVANAALQLIRTQGVCVGRNILSKFLSALGAFGFALRPAQFWSACDRMK